MKRYGWTIKVKRDKLAEYKALHAAVWPETVRVIFLVTWSTRDETSR